MTEGSGTASSMGNEIDRVWVEIDYAILQHFSQHLYSSPNKAIEELVTNGYDALAQRVDVFLPGTSAENCVLVWDDGESMDVVGLKHLWWIARSQKSGEDRIAISADGVIRRRMIGKFGIGKLASYAVGNRLAHLCRRSGRYLLVSVDYQQAPRLTDESETRSSGFSTPVRELDVDTAREYVHSLFRNTPEGLHSLLARDHWTIAIIDDLKEGVSLTEGRLAWVMGNGMPLRPDFAVHVNSARVAPAIEQSSFVDWDLSTEEIVNGLGAQWQSAVRRGDVTGDILFHDGERSGDEVSPVTVPSASVEIPGLGRVHARLRLFEDSLKRGRAAQHGRSEGFFVFVRGRLLNPDDAKLLLPDPSFGAFNRMQATIWADGLDSELLADRERLQRGSPATLALSILQQALYLVGRHRLEAYDDEKQKGSQASTVLPAESREFFRQPLIALALHQQEAGEEGDGALDPTRTTLASEAAAESDQLMRIDTSNNQLVLNTTHPLYTSVREKVGDNKRGKEALRLVQLIALSDILLQGHLIDIGIDDRLVDRIFQWREGQLRGLAVRYETQPDDVIREAYDASFTAGSRFERAIAQVFRLMGFVAERDGSRGQKDVLVVAPVGEKEFRFTVETKGSRNGYIANDAAEISGAASHASKVGARFALVVSRSFAGFEVSSSEEPAILSECRSQNPPVAIATVEVLHALYDALHANHYSLPSLVPILERIESPGSKLDAVNALRRPTDKFDVRDLLERTWTLQQGSASGEPVSALQLRQSRADWKSLPPGSFARILFGIDALSGGLFMFRDSDNVVSLLQSPEIVVSAIEAAVARQSAADGGTRAG